MERDAPCRACRARPAHDGNTKTKTARILSFVTEPFADQSKGVSRTDEQKGPLFRSDSGIRGFQWRCVVWQRQSCSESRHQRWQPSSSRSPHQGRRRLMVQGRNGHHAFDTVPGKSGAEEQTSASTSIKKAIITVWLGRAPWDWDGMRAAVKVCVFRCSSIRRLEQITASEPISSIRLPIANVSGGVRSASTIPYPWVSCLSHKRPESVVVAQNSITSWQPRDHQHGGTNRQQEQGVYMPEQAVHPAISL